MSKIIAVGILAVTLYLCTIFTIKREKKLLPEMSYTPVDISNLDFKQTVYVPVHSKLYLEEGARQLYLSNVLKLRNTSFSDSIYVCKVDYYDHEGELLKRYLDAAVLLKPMSTLEIVVKKDDCKGRGDNFIVEWCAFNATQPPLIQTITTDISNNIVFTNKGVVIQQEEILPVHDQQ